MVFLHGVLDIVIIEARDLPDTGVKNTASGLLKGCFGCCLANSGQPGIGPVPGRSLHPACSLGAPQPPPQSGGGFPLIAPCFLPHTHPSHPQS